MAFGIIVRERKSGTISKENRKEYANEKRVKELARRGYTVENIRAMTSAKTGGISEHHVERMIKHHAPDVVLDGKL